MMLGQSTMNIYWKIPTNTELGKYRIRHFGSARSFLGPTREYVGTTQTFEVV